MPGIPSEGIWARASSAASGRAPARPHRPASKVAAGVARCPAAPTVRRARASSRPCRPFSPAAPASSPADRQKKSPPSFPRGRLQIGDLGRRASADDLEVLGRTLAVAALDEFVLHSLPLAQAVIPGPLDGRYVDERVGSPTIRLNEPIALGGVEPLHSSGLQRTYPLSAGIHAGQPRHDARPNATPPLARGADPGARGHIDDRPWQNIMRRGANHKRPRVRTRLFRGLLPAPSGAELTAARSPIPASPPVATARAPPWSSDHRSLG
jgi:hypothetical protein